MFEDGVIRRQGERDESSDSLPRWSQHPGSGQVPGARSQDLHPGLSHGRLGSKHLGHLPTAFQVQGAGLKVEQTDLDWNLYEMLASQAMALPTVPQHWPHILSFH